MRLGPLGTSIVAGLLLVACSSNDDKAAAKDAGVDVEIPTGPLGGARPVTPLVPESYRPGTPVPLVIELHGYSAGGLAEDVAIFQFRNFVNSRGFILLTPDGTPEKSDGAIHNKFWNATDACCDFYASGVDDVAYLTGLIDEASQAYSIDPKRVYFIGHSNGGYMSHRLACDRADRIAAILSLAGVTWLDASRCQPTDAVSLLAVHGTADTSVKYDGEAGAYPSEDETVQRFLGYDGCSTTPTSTEQQDDVESLPGAETTATKYATGCQKQSAVEVWKMEGASHIPGFTPEARVRMIDFLLAHPKP